MSMLAGPRRKQKVINLRAKNNAWSNDNSKFGQRMLEKMGWSEGKGLGSKENGIIEHVVARYKNDDKGLGFEDRNDQWTKHEDEFNSLLANLSNGNSSQDKLHSGISLEDKSKKSKARVHYHKFTRGKDLTRYSERDLANIFGKKSLKNEEKFEQPPDQDLKTTEQVFTEKGSMEDYFKNKLAAIKSKSLNVNRDERQADCGFQGFSETNDIEESNAHQGFGFTPFSFEYNSTIDKDNEKEALLINNKTNSKKIKEKETCIKNNVQDSLKDINDKNEVLAENSSKKNKKKKRKHQELVDVIHVNNIPDGEAQNSTDHNIAVVKIKKKKSKNKDIYQNEDVQNMTIIESENREIISYSNDVCNTMKSKKKKSKKLENESNEIACNLEEHIECHIPKKKKKRKNKDIEN